MSKSPRQPSNLPRSKTRSTLSHQLQVSVLSRFSSLFSGDPLPASRCLTYPKTRRSILGWLSTVGNVLRPVRQSRTASTETSTRPCVSLSRGLTIVMPQAPTPSIQCVSCQTCAAAHNDRVPPATPHPIPDHRSPLYEHSLIITITELSYPLLLLVAPSYIVHHVMSALLIQLFLCLTSFSNKLRT